MWATLLDALAIFHNGTSFFTLICLLTALVHPDHRRLEPPRSITSALWCSLARRRCRCTVQHPDARTHINNESESDANAVEKPDYEG